MIKVKKDKKCDYYLEKPFALKINSFTKDEAGYIENWELKTPDSLYTGDDVEVLMQTLICLIEQYKLGYNTRKGEVVLGSRNKIIIYTDNVEKAKGFLFLCSTDCEFTQYVEVFEFIEIRNIVAWNKDVKTVYDIYDYAKFLIEEVFIPENYWFLTPNQIPRKHIKEALKNNDTVHELFPNLYSDYKFLRQALFGGILYTPYPGKLVERPMLALDLTSAYIYCLLVEEHCMTKFEEVNPLQFEFYMDDNNGYNSIGCYKIHYSSWSNKIHCFKDITDISLQKGDHEIDIVLNNVDLKILLSLCDNVYSCQCEYLLECKTGHLPKALMDIIVEEYIKKTEYTGNKKKVQKTVVNGIYGDTIKKINSEAEFKRIAKNPYMPPQWGVFTTSYCKRLLLELATCVEGWYYSATDSIYCLDTKENRDKLEAFNTKVRNKVYDFCRFNGYDFDKLKGLGEFKIEAEIKKFKVFRPGAYCYTTNKNKMVLKASGCNKEQIAVDDSLYSKLFLPAGTKLMKEFNPETTECDFNGKHYISYGSYWEKETKSSTE